MIPLERRGVDKIQAHDLGFNTMSINQLNQKFKLMVEPRYMLYKKQD